jgi:periplasmic protein TonB
MFEQLPETIPHKNKRKLEAFGVAIGLQIVLVGVFIILQMALPEKLGEFQLLTTLHMAAPPPPPPAPPSPAPEPVRRVAAARTPTVNQSAPAVTQQPEPIEKQPEIVAPTTIPKDIERIVESGVTAAGVTGGVPGGVSRGLPGGILGGSSGSILGGATTAPPVPPPSEPVRVGGNVKAPKPIHIEEPIYPAAAKRAGVEGIVVVEATVTAEGAVDKVKVISGPPLLVEAAAEAVSHWRYEPTYLNGQAIPVILTARITFSRSNAQK